MKQLVLATANAHKVIEFQRILNELIPDLELIAASSFPGVPEVSETGATFAENALLKARAISEFTKLPALADDSGLCVECLSGSPGIYSARYASPTSNDAQNVEKILKEIEDVETDLLGAHFECALAFVDLSENIELVVDGVMQGSLIKEVRGKNGFGYDPIFVPQGLSQTSAEISNSEKDQLSHRGKALRKMAVILSQLDFA